jgi:hypothetical protein
VDAEEDGVHGFRFGSREGVLGQVESQELFPGGKKNFLMELRVRG